MKAGITAVADLNGDGILDSVVQDSNDDRLLQLYLGQPDGTVVGSATYQTLGGFVAAIGDLNQDGIPDFVMTNYLDLDVFFGTRDGGFAAPVVLHPAGPVNGGAAIGDMNGDGLPDLVLAEDFGVEILPNKGDGTFGSPIEILSAPSSVLSPIAVDLNGDGRADIAVRVLAAWGVTVLLNHGEAGFERTDYLGPAECAGNLLVIPWGDDGPPDLAVANSGVSVLRNQGDGHFADGGFYPNGDVGTCTSILKGDFNGDCLPDIVTVADMQVDCATSGKVSVLYGNANRGLGGVASFQTGGPVGLFSVGVLGPVASPRFIAASERCGLGLSILGVSAK